MHATWNVLLKTASDPLRTAGRGMLVGAGFLVPIAIAGWLVSGSPPIPDDAWRLSVVSGVLEAAYFVDCILNNKKPFNDGAAGLHVVQVLEAADQSLQQRGKVIRL